MAYGRDMLRKAGQAILDMDERYANALFNKGDSQFVQGTRGLPLRDAIGYTEVRDELGNELAPDFRSRMNDGAYAAANIGARYGLPGLGLTAGAKGIYDLTAAFGNGADYQEEGQLPI